jgi:tRNA pseudouridine65 synthase
MSVPLLTAPRAPLEILYRDQALVIVNKPSGLAAHRGYDSAHGDYVLTRVRDALGQRVYLAHRLDRATSGAQLLALDPGFIPVLQRAFEQGEVEKRYLALARGVLEGERDVDYAIPRADGRDAPRVAARTIVRPIAVLEASYTLVEAEPLTGRYHQVRRHLKHLRHPIVGDTSYGDGKHNRRARERFGLLRLFLHASKLRLPHPATGQPIEVAAPLPEDLARTLRMLGFSAVEELGQREPTG